MQKIEPVALVLTRKKSYKIGIPILGTLFLYHRIRHTYYHQHLCEGSILHREKQTHINAQASIRTRSISSAETLSLDCRTRHKNGHCYNLLEQTLVKRLIVLQNIKQHLSLDKEDARMMKRFLTGHYQLRNQHKIDSSGSKSCRYSGSDKKLRNICCKNKSSSAKGLSWLEA